jgi:hypothetical protein
MPIRNESDGLAAEAFERNTLEALLAAIVPGKAI